MTKDDPRDAAYWRLWRANNPGKSMANTREWRRTHPEWCLLNCAKYRAKKRGIVFELKLEDIKIPTHCPVLGMALVTHLEGRKGPRDDSPTLDRINPQEGYVRGNIQVISNKANMMKSSATPQELLAFAGWVHSTWGPIRG